MEELFDVVDEQDRVIGQAPRSEVHRRSLMHRAVHILAFDAAGRIWLQLRSARKDRCALMWDSSAAGHLGVGESYEACANREVREEMGIEVVPRCRFKIAACQQTDWEHVGVYTCRVRGAIRFNREEIERGEFHSIGSIARWMERSEAEFASGFVRIFREFQQRGWK
jgi:16S rRNA (adenine1518-N6/adenine1519-N6)-dimethyltransferase